MGYPRTLGARSVREEAEGDGAGAGEEIKGVGRDVDRPAAQT